MNKITFTVKFDTLVDSKDQFNEFSKFWDNFFIKNMDSVLLNTVEYSEAMAEKQVEHGLNGMNKEKFEACYFEAFRKTAEKTTKSISDSISYNIKNIDGNFQEIDVNFSIDYDIPQNGYYCPSIESYINRFMINGMVTNVEQLRLLTLRVNNVETDRLVKLDNHFLDLLKQMKDSLKIVLYFKN